MANTIHNTEIKEINECFVINENGKCIWFHDKFGSFLINTLHIYSKNNTIYLYKNGIYVKDETDILRTIQLYCKEAKDNFRKEVERYIQIAAPVLEIEDNVNLIACKNIVLNIKDKTTLNFSKDHFLYHRIGANYDPNATCPAIDTMLDKITCNRPQIRSLIEEMIGYCLLRNCRFQKIFLLRGFGSNGKSTLIQAITNLLGYDNCSALSLNDLQDKFKKPELQDKLANLCDDLSNAYIKETEDFKKIAVGGQMTMERKNQQPFKYTNYAKLIMAANEIPKSADKTEGYYRRFIIIPLDAKIKHTDTDYNPNINDIIATEQAKSYLLNLALTGLERLTQRGYFEVFDDVKMEIEQYKSDNDPIVAFVNEFTIPRIHDQSTDTIFEEFCNWYKKENNKFSNYTKTTFTRTLSRVFDIGTQPTRSGRKYVYIGVDTTLLPVVENDDFSVKF